MPVTNDIFSVVTMRNLAELEARIGAGGDVNLVDAAAKHTPLMQATKMGWVEGVRCLVDAGADTSLRDAGGDTPLMFALYNEKAEISICLAQAMRHETPEDGLCLAFQWAVKKGMCGTVSVFLENGMPVDQPNIFGGTALHEAAQYSRADVVGVLLAAGADKEARDEYGRTALAQASRAGAEGVAVALLDAGADINARDNDGRTPLMNAAACGTSTLVTLLIARGAALALKNNQGHTAADIARAGGDIVECMGLNAGEIAQAGKIVEMAERAVAHRRQASLRSRAPKMRLS